MKKNLFSIAFMLMTTAITFAQLTEADVNILFDGKDAGASSDNWAVDNNGTDHMSTLEITDNVVIFHLKTNHASWYPNLGEFYPGNYLDCSTKNKLIIKAKLPSAPENFKIEPLAIAYKIVDGSAASYGWEVTAGDTVRLNSSDFEGSNPEFAAKDIATGGDWQTLEYEVKNWHSTFPAKSIWIDSTKIVGVRVYYGWNTGDSPLEASIEVDWAVFVAPETTASDVEDYMSAGQSSVNNSIQPGKTIFPNPANDFLHIQAQAKAQINLISITGKVVESRISEGKEVVLDTKDLGKGVYFIQINQGNNQKTEKILLY
jgi:hypothetical protein